MSDTETNTTPQTTAGLIARSYHEAWERLTAGLLTGIPWDELNQQAIDLRERTIAELLERGIIRPPADPAPATDPARPVPTLPTTAYAVYWAAVPGEPEVYEPCVSADEALSVGAIYPAATAVTAPIAYGPWTPISAEATGEDAAR